MALMQKLLTARSGSNRRRLADGRARIVNVYCDESCTWSPTRPRRWVLGAVWCPRDDAHAIKSARG
jgi:hypothetical protein